ncbi:MAG: CoA transferase [Pseudomonadota bacterium]
MTANTDRPLDGIRVIELGQLLAGPFTGAILGYFGAEVIKVEPPGTGDPIRGWRVLDDEGTSLWWRSIGRNKKSVTLDLKTERGRELAKQLMLIADVVVENFRPGVMEEWGLGPDDLEPLNPSLIFARISGYGQTGPYSTKPGYASVTEGMSGFRYVNGFPGGPPVRPNLSIGDTISAIHAALGVCLALLQRQRGSGSGQVVDVALYESMFNLMEAVVPEFSGAGVKREPSGTTVTGIVPTNTYTCGDGKYVVIGGNGDSIFKRLMAAAGRSDMAENPAMADNAGRVENEAQIDAALADWCASLPAADIVSILEAERVPVGLIYNVEDQMNDPHFHARGMFQKVDMGGDSLTIPAITPVLSDTPGRTDWPGGEVGSHNQEVLQGLLKLSDEEIASLIEEGVCS